MVFNNVILKVKDPQRIDEIAGLLSQQASCHQWSRLRAVDQSGAELFLLIEVWASEGHLAQHRKRFATEPLPLVHREPQSEDLAKRLNWIPSLKWNDGRFFDPRLGVL